MGRVVDTNVPERAATRELSDEQAASQLLICALSWEPEARLLGNIRASDVEAVARLALKATIEVEPERLHDLTLETP